MHPPLTSFCQLNSQAIDDAGAFANDLRGHAAATAACATAAEAATPAAAEAAATAATAEAIATAAEPVTATAEAIADWVSADQKPGCTGYTALGQL
ncbi:MAG: hypothetical protein WDW38_002145 [Sanguina aurantia]